MKTMFRSGAALALCVVLLLALCPAAFAQEISVGYAGGTEKFRFSQDAQLFPDFDTLAPGGTLTQSLKLENTCPDADYVRIYLRAEPRNPGSDTAKESIDSLGEYLKKLTFTVKQGDKTLAQNTPEKGGAGENLLLATLKKGEKADLTLEISRPETLGANYVHRDGLLDWVFVAEERNSNASLSLTKEVEGTPKNGKTYALAEEITYRLVVKNQGNVVLKNIKVQDKLTGLNETIAVLNPGESKTFTVKYKVTEKDLIAGSIVNTAEASATPEDPDLAEQKITAKATVTPQKAEPKLSLAKVVTSKPANNSYYTAGETITYEITVKNEGNLTLKNVKISDPLTGDNWTLTALAPGASQKYTAKHKVTQAEASAGSVVNTVSGTAATDDTAHAKVDAAQVRVQTPAGAGRSGITNGGTTNGGTTNPKTADGHSPLLWLAVGGAALAALAGLTRRRFLGLK